MPSTGKIRRRVSFGLLALLLILALITWWRMGSVVFQYSDEGYAKLPEKEDGPTTFSVLAYNVQARPWFDDSRHKFQYISPLLNRFDIVGIQECFKDYEYLWDGTDHPEKIYQGTLARPWKLVGSGLSMLSRFPAKRTMTMHFSHGGNFENSMASKGIIHSRMNIHGAVIDVYNTHMVAARKEPSMIARRIQGRELIDFVQATSSAESPIIFLGDFNMRHSRGDDIHPEIAAGKVPEHFDDLTQTQIFAAILLALDLTDVGEELHGEAFDGVDHVLYRSGENVRLTPVECRRGDEAFFDPAGEPLSDHEPLMVKFRLEPIPSRIVGPGNSIL